jgi:hypothetical protein
VDLSSLLDRTPSWLLLALTVGLILLCWEVGFQNGQRRRSADGGESLEGEVVAATLGLLAFLLAFTFGMAASRFEDRRQVLLAETVTIREAYMRAGLAAEPHRSAIRATLREYLDVRLQVQAGGSIDTALVRSRAMHDELWAHAVAIGETDKSDIAGMVIESLGEVIEAHMRRVAAALRSRIPTSIWMALYGVTALGMATMGHHAGRQRARHVFPVLALSLAFAVVMLLIADLDGPQRRTIRLSQQTMLELQDWMNQGRAR